LLLTTGEVLSHKKYGEHYHSLTIVAPAIGERVRPGQFVNIACGRNRSSILRRPFSVYRVHKRGGWSSTIEVVFDNVGEAEMREVNLRAKRLPVEEFPDLAWEHSHVCVQPSGRIKSFCIYSAPRADRTSRPSTCCRRPAC
jgi:hypothetical protein